MSEAQKWSTGMTDSASMAGVGDVAASHHAAISRSQAVASGLGPAHITYELERSALRPLAPRVFGIHGAPNTWQQLAMAATLTANHAAVLPHRAAARVHGIDGFTSDLVEVTVPHGRRVRIDGVVVHQAAVPDDHLVEIDGIPCTSLARTIVDLPQVVSPRMVERAIDDYQRKGYSLDWLEQVAIGWQRRGRRGSAVILRSIEARRRSGAVRGSWFEKLIEEIIASPLLPPPVQQHVIYDSKGKFIARVDLAFPEVRLGVEAHSRSFHTGIHQEIVDQRRENRAMMEGWQFLYLGWADRKTPLQARRFLERVVARRRLDLGLGPAGGAPPPTLTRFPPRHQDKR